MRILGENKSAYWHYEILDTFEAGIVLDGCEVKPVKQGKIHLRGSFVRVINGEAFLVGATIPRYAKSSDFDYDPKRSRKLLLNKEEISKLIGVLAQRGYSAIPLKVYEDNDIIKLVVGIGRGRKRYEKRRVLKERQEKRDAERELRAYKRAEK